MLSPELHTNVLLLVWSDPELTEVSGSFCDLHRRGLCQDVGPAHKQSKAARCWACVSTTHADFNLLGS